MRVMYTGMDERTRVAEANRVKFMEDGFRRTDKHDERDENLTGPVIVAHVYRSRGGKRLMLQPPTGFDMKAAQQDLLRYGFIDLTNCVVRGENLY